MKIIGFSYFFSSGIEIIPYYINNFAGNWQAGIKYDIFNFVFTLFYNSEDVKDFVVGINLAPLTIFILLIKATKSD